MAPSFKQLLRPAYHGVLRALPLTLRRKMLYAYGVRRWGNFRNPNRFTEKVNWRIIHDRRNVLAPTCDKEAMKQVARDRLGNRIRVPETLWFGTDTASIVTEDLPERWVMKPNHRAGRVHFGQLEDTNASLSKASTGWLDNTNSAVFGEWAYSQAREAILIEEFLGNTDVIPSDYKVYVFNGRAELIQLHENRFGQHAMRYYDRNWVPMEVHNVNYAESPIVEKLPELELLLESAESIAKDFDFMRVDFYIIAGEVWFGEVSPYPAGGISVFSPANFDRTLGSFWTLPVLPVR